MALIDASAPETHPFHGQFCGGVVVDARQILTAAHCVAGRMKGDTDVIVGADNLCRGRAIDGIRAHVVRTHVDSRWDPVSARFDLALLTVDEDLADAVRLGSGTLVGGDATALGWGAPGPMAAAPCRLTATVLRVVDQRDCPALVGTDQRRFDPASMLCAVPSEAREDTCGGDSGGPLFLGKPPHLGDLTAIVSWGRGCGQGFAGVYARLDELAFTAPT